VPKVHASLFARLRGQEAAEDEVFDVCQRPVVELEGEGSRTFLGARSLDGRAFELLAPHVKGVEFTQHGLTRRLDIPGGRQITLRDTWLDLEQEDLEAEILAEAGDALANRVPEALRFITLGMTRLRESPIVFDLCPLLYETEPLVEEAQEPLIVSMEREAHRTLRDLRTRLTRHLQREPRMQKLSRVQELDPYCLRHLIHQPGRNVAEKAGQRQEIMGVYRKESHDSWENRFVKSFASLLISEGQRYVASRSKRHSPLVRGFVHSLSSLVTDPSFAEVRTMSAASVRLNNVLLRRPDYHKVYRAYRAYLARKRQIERLWPCRAQAFADWLFLHIAAALVRIEGALVETQLPVPSEHADHGRFLPQDASVSVRFAVASQAFVITLGRGEADLSSGDLRLDVTCESLDAALDDPMAIRRRHFPVWAMWGVPSPETRGHARAYLEEAGLRGGLAYWTDDASCVPETLGPLSLLPLHQPRHESEPGEALTNARAFGVGLFSMLIEELRDAAASERS